MYASYAARAPEATFLMCMPIIQCLNLERGGGGGNLIKLLKFDFEANGKCQAVRVCGGIKSSDPG